MQRISPGASRAVLREYLSDSDGCKHCSLQYTVCISEQM